MWETPRTRRGSRTLSGAEDNVPEASSIRSKKGPRWMMWETPWTTRSRSFARWMMWDAFWTRMGRSMLPGAEHIAKRRRAASVHIKKLSGERCGIPPERGEPGQRCLALGAIQNRGEKHPLLINVISARWTMWDTPWTSQNNAAWRSVQYRKRRAASVHSSARTVACICVHLGLVVSPHRLQVPLVYNKTPLRLRYMSRTVARPLAQNSIFAH